MQPYFLPYIGYFQLINAVDKYVVVDDVNYIKGGWINRNYFLVNNEKQLITVSLKSKSQNKLINEIEIADDLSNFIKTIRNTYSRAPFFTDSINLLEEITSFKDKQLANFIFNSLRILLDYLHIDTEIILSSNLQKDNSLRAQKRVIDICKIHNADTYINPIGGQGLYNKEDFKSENIDLHFLRTVSFEYPQLSNNFVQNLSILDVLMFNSVEDIRKMLDKYELI